MALNYKLYILLTSNSSLTFIPILLNNNSKNGDLLFHHFSILFGWCNHRREPYQDVLIFLEGLAQRPRAGLQPSRGGHLPVTSTSVGVWDSPGGGVGLGEK